MSWMRCSSLYGWPSFFQPIDRAAVELKLDYKLLIPRTEVCCAACNGHLGHVFEDGPEPTGQRYCLNGVALEFTSDANDTELATTVALRQEASPFKPDVGSQLPGIVFNGIVGGLFFSSFVSRMTEGSSSLSLWDIFPIVPAIVYGVMAARSIQRLL